ncbi:hypothetical protein OLE27_09925 [Streptococcus pneumoniae]|nr:hypothetical protein [Streptococcus pneumoniae]
MNIKALIKKYEAVECVVGIVSGKTILNFDIEKHFVEEVAIVNLSKFHSYFEDRV